MDTGGLLGPNYNFADQLTTPSEIGIERDGSFGGVLKAASGVSYYVDAIGFGENTYFLRDQKPGQRPLDLRYFLKTGQVCSNGADMYEYNDTVPKGMGGRAGEMVKTVVGANLRGLAPGILEDAVDGLNPLPMFNVVMASGYPQCKKSTLPVGDDHGRIASHFDKNDVFIREPTRTKYVRNGEFKGVSEGNKEFQTRWVLDKYISQEDYEAAEKTESPGVFPTEGFLGTSDPTIPRIAAGALFVVLLFGMITCVRK